MGFVRLRVAGLLGCLFVIAAGMLSAVALSSQPASLRATGEAEIRATIEAYRSAWLRNDAKGVLDTFTDDGVLLPAHGAAAIVGKPAIEEYWFTPGGPPTTITQLEITVEQVSGEQTVAFARGLDNVGWTVTQGGATHRHFHPGTYLNVMKRGTDGHWRIQVHMWDDGAERID